MRLVFIEGVSGVGKTTITQKLCDKLREKGFSASCHLEFDFTNPIDFYSAAYFKRDEYEALLVAFPNFSGDIRRNTIAAEDVRLVRYFNGNTPLFSETLLSKMQDHEFCWNPVNLVPISEYARVYKAVWEQFAQNADVQAEYVLFDGSLLHHPINDMTRNYGASDKQATGHINTLIEATRPHHTQVIYLSANNVAERLQRARISRNEASPSKSQIQFWIDRKQKDVTILKQLGIPYDSFDISQENWDSEFDAMLNCIIETPEQRRARIYPIILSEYNPAWPQWFVEEKAELERLIGTENIARISHIGSTSVPGLLAKPTIDIMLEIKENADIDKLKASLPPDYICLDADGLTVQTPPPHLRFIKGYLPDGFAERVFHIHVVYPGDNDEILFRDYLIAHPEAAAEYAALKRELFANYEHDRDGYTEAKTEFVKNIVKKARV